MIFIFILSETRGSKSKQGAVHLVCGHPLSIETFIANNQVLNYTFYLPTTLIIMAAPKLQTVLQIISSLSPHLVQHSEPPSDDVPFLWGVMM